MTAMDRDFWRITGHAGMDQIFERIVPRHSLSEAGVRLLLQCLLAREIDVNRLIDGLCPPGSGPDHTQPPLDVVLEPGPPACYRLGRAGFTFEATAMTERPQASAPGAGSGHLRGLPA